MSNLVNCPKCKAEIENDSFFCDQCGAELYICPQCHTFGKGKRCTQCGQLLVPAKDATKQQNVNQQMPKEQQKTPSQPMSRHLLCHALHVRLLIEDGVVIGRVSGDYTSVFGNQSCVSGTHARIKRNTQGEWTITDLDSTNGTYINGHQLVPNMPSVFRTGDVITIADIDFMVQD